MPNFAASPPEVTSTLVYAGSGSAPMIATASAWDALAAQLDSFANGYSSAISSLQEGWMGPASNAMAAAATPYLAWATTTAAQAEQTASQVRAAAAAFETAHAAVVPPTLVAANRTQLANLIATNLLGQNTTQIATTEAAYDAMWAQDTGAMYGYATSASSATKLTPFKAPPPTANPTGQSAQGAGAAAQAAGSGASHVNSLSQLLSGVPQQLSAAATPAAASSDTSTIFGMPVPSSLLTSVGDFNTISGPVSFMAALTRTVANSSAAGMIIGRLLGDAALYAPLAGLSGVTSPVTFGAAPLAAGLSSSNAVLASASTAGLVGPLSVPQAWAQATPVAAVASQQAPWLSEVETWWEAGAPATMGTESLAEVAAAAAAGTLLMRPVVGKALKVPPRRFKMSSPKSGG